MVIGGRFIVPMAGPDDGMPGAIVHDGINDAFAERGSTFRYCYEGLWPLAGSD